MNEQQRMQYLEALGVDSYMPRLQLVAARPSVACAPVRPVSIPPAALGSSPATPPLVTSDTDSQVSRSVVKPQSASVEGMPVSPSVTPAPRSPSSSVLEALSSSTAKPHAMQKASEHSPLQSRPEQDRSIPSQDALRREPAPSKKPVANTASTPRFALTFWRVDEALLVVDSRRAELALPTDTLLLNILRALGVPVDALPQPDILRWPMTQDRYTPQGETEARESSWAMLEAMHESKPLQHVMLMGEDACHYLMAAGVTPEDSRGSSIDSNGSPLESLESSIGQLVNVADTNVKGVVVPSLSDMLLQPTVKARVWESIQFLRRV